MARGFALSTLAALLAPAAGQDSEYAAQFMRYYMAPGCVPTTDKCCVDCSKLCTDSFSEGILKPPMSCGTACGMPAFMVNSQKYCLEACIAHSIQTTRPASGWQPAKQQGKYVQKVMAEYCDRGLCKPGERPAASSSSGWGGGSSSSSGWWSGAQREARVEKHEQQAGEAWKVPAKASGWPSGCETSSYYCDQLCANMYHETSEQLGAHPGADSNWPTNRKTCVRNCNAQWSSVKESFDAQCACTSKHGVPFLPPGFLQESEEVDVGAFIQMPREL